VGNQAVPESGVTGLIPLARAHLTCADPILIRDGRLSAVLTSLCAGRATP
jgi:hypothetical protein